MTMTKEDIGATGKFPTGKLTDTDEGEIQFEVSTYKGKVILNFGKSVRWMGLSDEQARSLAHTLLEYANDLDKDNKLKDKPIIPEYNLKITMNTTMSELVADVETGTSTSIGASLAKRLQPKKKDTDELDTETPPTPEDK